MCKHLECVRVCVCVCLCVRVPVYRQICMVVKAGVCKKSKDLKTYE